MTASRVLSRAVPARRGGLRNKLRDRRVSGWLFLLPLLAFNLVVVLIPSAFSIWYSFTDWTGISSKATFAGLGNYADLVRDPEFVQGLVHNLLWTAFFLVVPMAMGLFGAFALARIVRFQLLFRTLYFIPYIVASVVNSSIWRSILDPQNGLGNLLHINPLAIPTWHCGRSSSSTTGPGGASWSSSSSPRCKASTRACTRRLGWTAPAREGSSSR